MSESLVSSGTGSLQPMSDHHIVVGDLYTADEDTEATWNKGGIATM